MTAMSDDHPVDPALLRLASGCAEERLLVSRRAMMGITAGLFTWAYAPRWAEAAPSPDDPRLLVVVLRGGMDGLNTIIPHGDPYYVRMRGDMAMPKAETIALDSFFGLHPSMPNFGDLFVKGEASVVHATCTPLRNRSHFEAQDNLESGLPGLGTNSTGWLNRLLTALPAGAKLKTRGAIEIGEAPLILRGPAPVLGWSPTWFSPIDEETRNGVRAIYRAKDKRMLTVLDRGLAADRLAEGGDDGNVDALRKGFRGAGRLLSVPTGPRIAVLSVGGWDTHSNMGLASGMLGNQLAVLDRALADFKETIGANWQQTVVVCVTEFGRTVRANGDRGTDHGVGTVALLAGGAVAGGRVVCDWPGLGPNQLYEGSDLKPTVDLRAVFKGILRDHLDVPMALVNRDIFPESAKVAPLGGLVRRSSASDLRIAPVAAGAAVPLRPETALARYRRDKVAAAARKPARSASG
jgi:uncharacterized protein (DUF1501 family)